MQREVVLTDGIYYKEINRLQAQLLTETPEKIFYYAVPFHFWNKVSFIYVRNLRTNEPLNATIVRRDDFLVDLFFIRIELDLLPENGDTLMLFVEYHVAPGATYTSKFTSLLTNHSAHDSRDFEEAIKKDRQLEAVFAANCPQIYDISTQKTVVKVPVGTYVRHNTTFSPAMQKGDKIELGPLEYAAPLEFENITVVYSAEAATLEASVRRHVFPSGLPIRVGDFENQLARVHVIDEINFTNTDPAPEGLRESRMHIHMLKQQKQRIIEEIALNLPKASNIEVKDRVGKVASNRKYNGPDMTQVTVSPRHELFGQQVGQIVVEYDTDLVKQDGVVRGFMMPPAPRLTPTPYFSRMEVCVYPPSTAKNVEYFAGFPVDFEYVTTS